MKRRTSINYFLVSILVLFIMEASAKDASVSISVTVTGEVPRKEIYLFEHFGTDLNAIDTTEIVNGTFQFKLKHPDVGLYRVGYKPDEAGLFVLAHESITATCDLSNIAGTFEVNGSEENEAFDDYIRKLGSYYNGLTEVDKMYNLANQQRGASEEQYQERLKNIRSQFDSLNAAINDYYIKTAKEKSELFVGKISEPMIVTSETTADNFFDKSDFAKPVNFSNDLLQRKINHYFMVYYTGKDLKADVDKILSYSVPKTPGRELAYRALINRVYVIDKNQSKDLAKAYKAEFPDSEVAERLVSFFPPEIGDQAPEIALKNTEGEVIPLSSLKGKVVLLDFWASWCGPCRRENPNVVQAYNKYKDKGFTVYSVSLDRNKESWVRAIQQDGLIWPNHVSDLKHWQSEAAASYRVTGIPMAFLIDQEGKIIAKNLRGRSLDNKLEEIFSE